MFINIFFTVYWFTTFILFILGYPISNIVIGCAILTSVVFFGYFLTMNIIDRYIEKHPNEYKEFLEEKIKEVQDEKPFD